MTTVGTTGARLTVSAPELAAALDAVRFATSNDPDLPMLRGVLFDIEAETLGVVATDRYRMAVARTGAAGHDGTRVRAIVPVQLADAMRALLDGESRADITVADGRATLDAGGRQTTGRCLDHEFPDYRRLVQLPKGRCAVVDVPALRAAVETAPVRRETREPDGVPFDIVVLRRSPDNAVTVSEGTEGEDEHVAVNREFLLHALSAGGRDRLLLEFGGPTAPLAIRRPGDDRTFSILMPVRLDE